MFASLLLLLLALIPLAPLLTGDWFPFQHDLFLSDLLHLQIGYHAELHQRLTEWSLPQWWPEIFSGAPFWAQIETQVLWPPNVIASYFFQAPQSLNVLWIFNTLIGGLSGWYYAKSLGARPLVSAFAGVAWSLSGGMISHLKHPNIQAAIAVMPLMFATLENALNGRRGFSLFSASVATSLFAGMPQVTWIALLGCAVRAVHFWQFAIIREHKARSNGMRQMAALGLATILSFMSAAVILLPTFRMNQHAARQSGLTYDYAFSLASAPAEMLSVFLPLDPQPYASATSMRWESWFYQGLLLAVLGVLGWFWTTRERRVAWELILLMCVALAFENPLSRLAWPIVPGMNLFRFHDRFFLLVSLVMLSFGIEGLESLLRRVPVHSWRIVIPIVVICITLFDLSVHERSNLMWRPWSSWTQVGEIEGVIPPNGRSGRLLHIDEYWRMMKLSLRGPSNDPDTYRDLQGVPLGSIGTLHHLWSAGGYTNLVHTRVGAYFKPFPPESMLEYFQPLQWRDGRITPAWHSMLDRASVGYVLTERAVDPAGTMPLLLDGPTRILRNDTMLPRAYVARAWVAVRSNAEAASYMQGPGTADSRVPAIEDAASDGSGAHEPVAVPIVSPVPEQVEIDLTGAPAGWLVLTDSQDEGWTATLDGQPAAIHYANGYQRAVEVPVGSRHLVFRYRTPGLVLGAAVSACGLLTTLAWCCIPALIRRRRRRAALDSTPRASG